MRVTRGGSFHREDRYSDDFRSAAREQAWASWEKTYIGFRVAREMTVPRNPVPVPLE